MIATLSGYKAVRALLTLILIPALLQAQTQDGPVKFLWGDSYELPKRHEDLGFIGNEQDGYVQIGHAPHRSLSFQHFDGNLHLTSENIAELGDMPKDYQNVAFMPIGNKYYWLFCTWSRSDEKERLYAQEIDIKNGRLTGAANQLCMSDKLMGVPVASSMFWSFGSTNKWSVTTSLDSTKILVHYRKKPERRDDSRNKDIIGFQVFDNQLNKIWGKEIRMPYTEDRMDNEAFCLDRDGNVYTLAKVYNEDKGSRKKPNYKMEILKWNKDNNDVIKIPFSLGDRFVNVARITRDFNNRVMVAGYYSNRKNARSVDGVFLLRLDEESGTLSNIKKGIYPFPSSVLSEFESERTKRKNERKDEDGDLEASELQLRNIIVKDDGSIQIFGEEAYVSVYISYNGRTSTTRYYYYFNDILGMNIGNDGELKWVAKIPKAQYGVNTGLSGMSFKLFPYKNNFYLFFMDNIKNLDLPVNERPAQHVDKRGGVLMVVRLDEQGQKSKAKIFDVREEDKNIIVTDFSDVTGDKMLGRAFYRRESQPLFISFQ